MQSDYVHFSMHNVIVSVNETILCTHSCRESSSPCQALAPLSNLLKTASPHAWLPLSVLNHQQTSSTVSGPVPACAHSQIFELQRLVEGIIEPMGFDS